MAKSHKQIAKAVADDNEEFTIIIEETGSALKKTTNTGLPVSINPASRGEVVIYDIERDGEIIAARQTEIRSVF